MGSRTQFTPEFKREAVQLLESGSRPASEIARALGYRPPAPETAAPL